MGLGPLKRAIQKRIEKSMATELLSFGHFVIGDRYCGQTLSEGGLFLLKKPVN